MNYMEITKMLRNILADYAGMGRKTTSYDEVVFGLIMRVYNTDPLIDWEEVKWLWVKYLETGNLYFSKARELAEARHGKEIQNGKSINQSA